MTLHSLIALTGAIALSAVSAAALPPAEKCLTGKLKQAGKYGVCRLKAEAKARQKWRRDGLREMRREALTQVGRDRDRGRRDVSDER
jgi:hypothetical protein